MTSTRKTDLHLVRWPRFGPDLPEGLRPSRRAFAQRGGRIRRAVLAALAAGSCGLFGLSSAWAEPCGCEYRLEYRTEYDTVERTSYRLETETVLEEREVTEMVPTYETEQRVRRVTVQRPVTETSEREEQVVVRRPVTETRMEERTVERTKFVEETSLREETRRVLRPVTETACLEEQVRVQRPQTETFLQQYQYQVLRPVTTLRNEVVDQGGFVDQTVCIPGETRTGLGWRSGGYGTDPSSGQLTFQRPGLYWGPRQAPPTVGVQRTYVPNLVNVQVPQTSLMPEMVTAERPVTQTRMVESIETRRVPVSRTRMEEELQVREVPVTIRRPEVERVTYQVPVQVCRIQEEVVTRRVPVTRTSFREEVIEEPYEVQVCKMVPSVRKIQVPKSVTRRVPVVTQVQVPRRIAVKVPVGPCDVPGIIEDAPLESVSRPYIPASAVTQRRVIEETSPVTTEKIIDRRIVDDAPVRRSGEPTPASPRTAPATRPSDDVDPADVRPSLRPAARSLAIDPETMEVIDTTTGEVVGTLPTLDRSTGRRGSTEPTGPDATITPPASTVPAPAPTDPGPLPTDDLDPADKPFGQSRLMNESPVNRIILGDPLIRNSNLPARTATNTLRPIVPLGGGQAGAGPRIAREP